MPKQNQSPKQTYKRKLASTNVQPKLDPNSDGLDSPTEMVCSPKKAKLGTELQPENVDPKGSNEAKHKESSIKKGILDKFKAKSKKRNGPIARKNNLRESRIKDTANQNLTRGKMGVLMIKERRQANSSQEKRQNHKRLPTGKPDPKELRVEDTMNQNLTRGEVGLQKIEENRQVSLKKKEDKACQEKKKFETDLTQFNNELLQKRETIRNALPQSLMGMRMGDFCKEYPELFHELYRLLNT